LISVGTSHLNGTFPSKKLWSDNLDFIFFIERAGELRILYIREENKPYKRGDVAEQISQRPT
jgi:hypothetical protein